MYVRQCMLVELQIGPMDFETTLVFGLCRAWPRPWACELVVILGLDYPVVLVVYKIMFWLVA